MTKSIKIGSISIGIDGLVSDFIKSKLWFKLFPCIEKEWVKFHFTFPSNSIEKMSRKSRYDSSILSDLKENTGMFWGVDTEEKIVRGENHKIIKFSICRAQENGQETFEKLKKSKPHNSSTDIVVKINMLYDNFEDVLNSCYANAL
ncbi:MAG: hypothetical protein ACOC1X_02050 [Promethearchaeota archaeon]